MRSSRTDFPSIASARRPIVDRDLRLFEVGRTEDRLELPLRDRPSAKVVEFLHEPMGW